ncbi:YdeI/OmpD-associated family protein [Echinicola rosea]|uniref:YdhG-like domain-containing protein n=1 Tax=Echinicola rosea TaxID=1807691 RepID=A0ABQ1VCU4_9BACT|nr:DUF1801 domain-containing protein [Echinicola rosea]GGF48899.1 hypothetical protein GCM10011339_41940 [Echinicola rosea]
MNPKVDFFFDKDTQWKEAYGQLRKIALECGLTEELKWGVPCYTSPSGKTGKQANVVLIHGFKEYCALLFHKGALLKDTEGLLIQQTENVQAARQIRFTDVQEILSHRSALKTYIFEAIEVEKAGLEVKLKKTKEFSMPDEFKEYLEDRPELKAAFEKLTPGRQRGYLLHFSQPKQSKTKVSRIEKAIPRIFDGLGLND